MPFEDLIGGGCKSPHTNTLAGELTKGILTIM